MCVKKLKIGDIIVSESGIYKKIKQSVTVGKPANGTRILVSGSTDPSDLNGTYVLQSENVWKHESADYWITLWSSYYWLISATSTPSNPGSSKFYAYSSPLVNPWEVTQWSAMGSSGTLSLANVGTEEAIYNTLDLFESDILTSEVTKLGNVVNSANGLLQLTEQDTIPSEYLPDESRLLPIADPFNPFLIADGVIGDNNEHCKFLLQPSTSNMEIVDSAFGNETPCTVETPSYNGATIQVDENGDLDCTGGSNGSLDSIAVRIPANSLPETVLVTDHEWAIVADFTINSVDTTCYVFGFANTPRLDFIVESVGKASAGGIYNNWGTISAGRNVVRYEYFYSEEDSSWKIAFYLNGTCYHVMNYSPTKNQREYVFYIGNAAHSGRSGFVGKFHSFMILDFAEYKGANHTPKYSPYLETSATWSPVSQSEMASLLGSPNLPNLETLPEKDCGLPLIFSATNTTDNSFILRFPFLDDLNDHSLKEITTTTLGTVSLSNNDTPSSTGNSARFAGNVCIHGTLLQPLGVDPFTCNMWVKLDSARTNTLFSTRESNSTKAETFAIIVNSSNQVYIYSDNYKTSATSSYTQFTYKQWHHIRVIRDESGAVTILLDGKLHATGTMTNDLSKVIFALGGSYYEPNDSVAETMIGNICAFELLNYAMSTDEFEPEFIKGTINNRQYAIGSLDDVKTTLGISDTWVELEDTTDLVVDKFNGPLQRVTLTENCSLTAPVLDAKHPTLLLQVTSSNYVTIGAVQIWSSDGTFQVGWYWDGVTTRRYPVVEVE